jgi:hypothetical protein
MVRRSISFSMSYLSAGRTAGPDPADDPGIGGRADAGME